MNFGSSLKQFSENLDTLREYVEIAAPYFIEKQEEERRKSANVLAPLAIAFHEVYPSKYPLPGGITEDRIPYLRETFDIVIDETAPSGEKGFSIVFRDKTKNENFVQAIIKNNRRNRQIQHLYEVSLVSLTSTISWFLSNILHEYFEKFPGAVEGKEKFFSLQELNGFESIEQARKYLIDTFVENILRGSFEDWLAFVKNKLKLSCGYLDSHINSLSETFQRRNLLVHNGGVVNNIYFAKVTPEFRVNMSIGTRINVEPDYLDNRISLFEKCFILIASELWKQIDSEDSKRSEILIDISYKHLVAERWEISESLSNFTMKDAKVPEIDRLISTINYWQSLKWQGRFNEVIDAVRHTDFSATSESFHVARAILLDDYNTFYKILPHALESGALPEGALTEWPLFREVRKQVELAPFLEKDKLSPLEIAPSIRNMDSEEKIIDR